MSKIEIWDKNRNLWQNSKFLTKIEIWAEIEILRKIEIWRKISTEKYSHCYAKKWRDFKLLQILLYLMTTFFVIEPYWRTSHSKMWKKKKIETKKKFEKRQWPRNPSQRNIPKMPEGDPEIRQRHFSFFIFFYFSFFQNIEKLGCLQVGDYWHLPIARFAVTTTFFSWTNAKIRKQKFFFWSCWFFLFFHFRNVIPCMENK